MLRPARVYLSFYIVLILVLLVSGLSLMPNLRYRLTRNERKYLAGISVLRAVGDNSFPPFSYTSGGVPAGYEADLVKVLQNFIGVEIVLEQHLWTGVRQMLESGQADFVTGMRITPERLSTYAFSGP
ncbi:MAG: transporter substrate-binding domain-containing protein, partial [Peptococcaceae bacterium]|nr:transporter substrate-binding domain-containing protein [Peptococcaceae bacterium]